MFKGNKHDSQFSEQPRDELFSHSQATSPKESGEGPEVLDDITFDPVEAASSAPQSTAKKAVQLKRPRACEACRGLKVRCDFPSKADRCKRCARAKRRCVVALPSPRRPRRAETKVADLERQVQELTAALSSQQGQFSSSSTPADWMRASQYTAIPTYASPASWFPSPPRTNQLHRLHLSASSIRSEQGPHQHLSPLATNISLDLSVTEYADVIDRKFVTRDEAVLLFDYYNAYFKPWFPLLAFEDRLVIWSTRKTKPLLFLAVLTVASGSYMAIKHNILMREMLRGLAWQVFCKHEKSLELIQAMLILSIWYISDDAKDTTAFQLAQLAFSTATAMGLLKVDTQKSLRHPRDNRASSTLASDGHQLEIDRAVVGCYIVNGIMSLKLQYQNTVRWSSNIESCIARLRNMESSGNYLCKVGEVQCITDRVADLWVDSQTSQDKSAVERKLRRLSTDLASIREDVSGVNQMLLLLDVHEAASHADSVMMRLDKPLTAPAHSEKMDKLSSGVSFAQSEALQTCITSIHHLLDHFAAILEDQSPQLLGAIPSYHLNRVINVLMSLIGFHHSSLTPGSLAASCLTDPERELRIEAHVTKILSRLQKLDLTIYRRTLQRFYVLLKMLRAWYGRTCRSNFNRPHARPDKLLSAQRRVSQLPSQPVGPVCVTPRMGYRKLSVIDMDGDYLEPDTGFSKIEVQMSLLDSPHQIRDPLCADIKPLQHASTWPQTDPTQINEYEWLDTMEIDTPMVLDDTFHLTGELFERMPTLDSQQQLPS